MAKKNKRNEGYLSIRKKLIAAVAMLLVASFMVASSSYAWFTLSTAPEVTGIKTNVGANGSLEIALYTGSDEIKTNVGDSTLDPQDKNKTWGNQIDLSDDSYGLDKIKLYPARLNANADNQLGSAPLYTPVYGSDGRVKSLDDNTSAATYDGSTFSGIGEFGVKAIGSSSTMTDQQLDFRNALSSIDDNLRTAKMRAQDSLSADTGNRTEKGEVITTGSVLATIMADCATDAKTEFDITAMGLVLDELVEAQDALENAVKQWYLAALAVAMADYIDDAGIVKYEAAKALIEGTTLDELETGSLTVDDTTTITFTVPATIAAYTAKYEEIATAISSAKTAYDALNGSTTAVNETTMLSIVRPLVKNENITISDVELDQIIVNGEINKDALADLMAAMSSGGLELQLPAGSGVYADIAELVGELNASIKMSFTYDGIPLENVNCRMATKVSKTGDDAPIDTYALAFPAGTDADPSEDASGDIEKKLTDFYGYMIDLAFRTNADASNLMLQTTPVDRIYSSGGVEETLGSGSSMTFTSSNASFSTDDMKALMGNIRIAFVSSESTVIAMGGLDIANATVNGTEVTAYIYLYSQFAFTSDGRLVKSVTTNDEGETQVEELTVADLNTDDTKTALKSLAKNAVEKLSVLVYLDGDSVENGDVANATESMSGTMNLQFSSDAELKPMEYSPLQGSGSGSDDDDTPAATVTDITLTSANTFAANATLDLTATLTPAEATDSITWAVVTDGTTAEGAAITDGNKLTATGAGNIIVSATAGGKTSTFTITVTD